MSLTDANLIRRSGRHTSSTFLLCVYQFVTIRKKVRIAEEACIVVCICDCNGTFTFRTLNEHVCYKHAAPKRQALSLQTSSVYEIMCRNDG
jgi:hypothetical protein